MNPSDNLKSWRLKTTLSSVKRGQEKELAVLNWICRWGWASAGMIDKLSGSSNGYAKKLERHELVQGMRTESGGGLRGVPNFIYTLTELGQQIVEKDVEQLLQYEVDPFRINQANLRHDELVQKATFSNLQSNKIIAFETPRETFKFDEKNVKNFDVIFHDSEGKKTGIELELSGKWQRKLDQFIHSIETALKTKVHRVMVITDSKAIYERYQKSFTAGSVFHTWVKDSQSHWKPAEKRQVSAKFSELVTCVLLQN